MTALRTQDVLTPVPLIHSTQVSRTELTPLSFLRRSAAVFPDKTAVVHGYRGTTYNYRTFAERVDRLASALQAAGLNKHDRVAFLCRNSALRDAFAAEALRDVRDRFAWEDVAASMIAFYESARSRQHTATSDQVQRLSAELTGDLSA